MSLQSPKQWDIWYAELRAGIRGEQTYKHNVLVVSSLGSGAVAEP